MKKQLAKYSISRFIFSCDFFLKFDFKLNIGFSFEDTSVALGCNVFDSSNADKFKGLNQTIDLTDRGFEKKPEVNPEKNTQCKEVFSDKGEADHIPEESSDFKISLSQIKSNSLEFDVGNDWGQFEPLD